MQKKTNARTITEVFSVFIGLLQYVLAIVTDKTFFLPGGLSHSMNENFNGEPTLSPFLLSASCGSDKVFTAMLKSDVVKVYRDRNGLSALHKIFETEGTRAFHVEELCRVIDPNLKSLPGLLSPLHIAVFDSRDKLRALLDAPGLDINTRCNEAMTPIGLQTTNGMTPAHLLSFAINSTVVFASEEKYQQALDALDLLLVVGADFSLRDDEGRTPPDILRENQYNIPRRRDPRLQAFLARFEKQQLLEGLGETIGVKSEVEEQRPVKRRLM